MEIAIFIVFIMVLVGMAYLVFSMFFKKKEKKQLEEKHTPTTQDHLPIEYIRGGVVKLKKGGYRMLVELPSINIDLMEASEKQTILEQYRQILNSIDFPFQYLQQSRIVDISEYLDTLEVLKSRAKSNFIKNQLEFYSGYLVDLIKNRSVLTKRFYLVVPYDEERENKKKGKMDYHAFSKNKKQINKTEEEENDVYKEEKKYEKAKKQLYSRATQVERSFRRFDITPKILNDDELLELFYTAYNKDRSVYQPLKGKNPADFTTLRVKATNPQDE